MELKRNLLDRAISYFSPSAGLERDRARFRSGALVCNSYEAAGNGRRSEGWIRGTSDANGIIRLSLPSLRERSRELVRNNSYAAASVRGLVTNTIGKGITPGATGDDKDRRELAQSLMRDWAKQVRLFGLQQKAYRSMVEGGDCLIVRQTSTDPKLSVPLKLKLYEGDYLDHKKNQDLEGGGRIEQGVQFDADDEIEGYWLHQFHPRSNTSRANPSRFVSADQVIHLFEEERVGQVRGVPRGVSGFNRTKNIAEFQDARLEGQKVSAALVGFITDTVDPDAEPDEVIPDKLEPGMLPFLGHGKDVTFNSPPKVDGHKEYVTTESFGIATAYGVPYSITTGDYSQFNFASGRMEMLEFYRQINQFRDATFIPVVCERIEQWFLDAALIGGRNLKGIAYTWTPPKREMLDPSKEVPMRIKEVRGGLKSWSEDQREQGNNPEQTAKQIAEDNVRFDELGLVLDSDARQTTQSGQAQVELNHEEGDSSDDE